MRLIRNITAEEENFRTEPFAGTSLDIIRRDPIEPEPVGTIVLMAFRVTGYDPDVDGSLMARLDALMIDDLEISGWEVDSIGLYPTSGIVLGLDELKELINMARAGIRPGVG